MTGMFPFSFSNFILWRKTWCQLVTCWELELSMPEWLAQNIQGKCQPLLCLLYIL